MDNTKLEKIAKELAEYAHHKLVKDEPMDGDKTELLADKFLAELNLLNGNQNMISTKEVSIIDEGLEIDGELVPREIFDQDKHEYYPRDKDDMVDDLISWISEADDNNKQTMLDDLKYIMSHKDSIMLSSNSTNDYVFQSSEPESFDLICDELIEVSNHS